MIFGQNDLLSWLIHAAPERERTVKLLTRRVLAVNFAAILVGPRVFGLLCNADSRGLSDKRPRTCSNGPTVLA